MKTDRDLLELAAKAAGYWSPEFGCVDKLPSLGWNPLSDDGDALRLAVKLSMYLNIYVCEQLNQTNIGAACHHLITEEHSGYPESATRRAIVRAAAQIGENLHPGTEKA
jgi:hypothetical protein